MKTSGWDDLIEACTIFKKYGNGEQCPTHCEHDELIVYDGIDPNKVTDEDRSRLEDLGFSTTDEYGEMLFYSFRFGSC